MGKLIETDYTPLSEGMIKEMNNIIMKESPALYSEMFYGGHFSEGRVKFYINQTSDTSVEVTATLQLLVHGDFDEDEQKPHWIEYELDNEVVYYKVWEYDDDDEIVDEDEWWWEREDIAYHYDWKYKLVELLFDVEDLYGL